MYSEKLKKACIRIENYLKENKLKEAQIEIEEIEKRIILIEQLNGDWGTWRQDYVIQSKLELESRLSLLKSNDIVLNSNFEKNIKDLEEFN